MVYFLLLDINHDSNERSWVARRVKDMSWHFLGRLGEEVKRCRVSWKSGSGQEALLQFLDAFLVLTRGSRNNLQTSVPGFSCPTPQKRAKVTGALARCSISSQVGCSILGS